MKLPSPLTRGTLVQRYKRFLADVRLESGEVVTATCPNTGSMLGLTQPGNTVWLSRSANPSRKYPYTWEMLELSDGERIARVGINTGSPNAIVAEAIAGGRIPELTGYSSARREVKYGRNSRIDILLEAPGRPRCFVEVKNVHLCAPTSHWRNFPECRTDTRRQASPKSSQRSPAAATAPSCCISSRCATTLGSPARSTPPMPPTFDAARAAGVEALAAPATFTPGVKPRAYRLPILP